MRSIRRSRSTGWRFILLSVIRHLTALNLYHDARGSGLEVDICGAVRALSRHLSYHVGHPFQRSVPSCICYQEDEPRSMVGCFVSSSKTIMCTSRTCPTDVESTLALFVQNSADCFPRTLPSSPHSMQQCQTYSTFCDGWSVPRSPERDQV